MKLFYNDIDICGYICYNDIDPTKGGVFAGEKKMGRPTENPKNATIKFRIDDCTSKKLDECSFRMKVSKSEVLRLGVHKVHDDLNKE